VLQHILLDCKSGVHAMAVDPVRSYYFAAAISNDSIIRVFDRRMMKDVNNGEYATPKYTV